MIQNEFMRYPTREFSLSGKNMTKSNYIVLMNITDSIPSCTVLDLSRLTDTRIISPNLENPMYLIKIFLPNSVELIGDNFLYDCKSLTNITMSNSVEQIRNNFLSGCASLLDITLPKRFHNLKLAKNVRINWV